MTELGQMLNWDHFYTHPYSKEENGIVERSNKEVLRHLRNFIFGSNFNKLHFWADMLPLVQRIINGEPHSVTGVAPSALLYGNSLNLSRGIWKPRVNDSIIKLSLYAQEVLSVQEMLEDKAFMNQANTEWERLKDSTAIQISSFPIGSFVVAKYESKDNRPPHKLATLVRGPFEVLGEGDNINIVLVKDTVNQKILRFHRTLLQPYVVEQQSIDPLIVANQSQGYYQVEEILKHRRKDGKIELFVKWLGFEDRTWEPIKALQSNQFLHRYLRQHKLEKFLNKATRIKYGLQEQE
jgi:hypothetical protein